MRNEETERKTGYENREGNLGRGGTVRTAHGFWHFSKERQLLAIAVRSLLKPYTRVCFIYSKDKEAGRGRRGGGVGGYNSCNLHEIKMNSTHLKPPHNKSQ